MLNIMMLCILPLLVATSHAALQYKGVDWSSLIVEEDAGISYKTVNGKTEPLEAILSSSGVNIVRQRIWVNPSGGTYNLDYNLELAKRARAAGMGVYLDFHYSDTWADPSHQTTPAAWANYNIDDLAYKVYNYTLATMDSFQSASIPLSLVSIGNEITAGMLWPLGNIDATGGKYNLARLLHSASAGIKDSTITPKPKILIHLDNGWKSETQEWWYSTILSQGPLKASDYDVQAVSFYPFYNSDATLSALKSSLGSLKAKYGKEVMVVETDWPTKCTNPKYAFPADVRNVPFAAEGQETWMKDVAGVVEAVGGTGVFYWEPAWVQNAGLGSSCEDNLMVDGSGKALESLAVFGQL